MYHEILTYPRYNCLISKEENELVYRMKVSCSEEIKRLFQTSLYIPLFYFVFYTVLYFLFILN